jgi:hypothetical protein
VKSLSNSPVSCMLLISCITILRPFSPTSSIHPQLHHHLLIPHLLYNFHDFTSQYIRAFLACIYLGLTSRFSGWSGWSWISVI